jgi:hypothetical protein
MYLCYNVYNVQICYKGHHLGTLEGWFYTEALSVDIRLNFVNIETHVKIKSAN